MPSVVSGLLLVDLLYCHHVDSALYYSIEKRTLQGSATYSV